MEPMAGWEKILLGVGALLLILWFRPGIKQALRQSREAQDRDWKAFVLPLVLVALFVLVLIVMSR